MIYGNKSNIYSYFQKTHRGLGVVIVWFFTYGWKQMLQWSQGKLFSLFEFKAMSVCSDITTATHWRFVLSIWLIKGSEKSCRKETHWSLLNPVFPYLLGLQIHHLSCLLHCFVMDHWLAFSGIRFYGTLDGKMMISLSEAHQPRDF